MDNQNEKILADEQEQLLNDKLFSKIDKMNDSTININGFDFVCTCSMCPEQYDVYHNGEYVGYVRKRWGHLRVNPTKLNDETDQVEIDLESVIYELDDPEGNEYNGSIDDNERLRIFHEITQKLIEIGK